MGTKNKKIKKIKKLPIWAAFLFAVITKGMSRCLYKVKVEDPNGYIPLEENFIVTIWHNRLLFLPSVFPKKVRIRSKAVISASRDGQYVTDIVRQFGLGAVRGSSSRRGANAQRGAIKAIKENWHVIFTPDGPRGPKYYMHHGPVHLASATGHRIAPVAVNASRYWEFKSWDKFQIPKPFSTLTVLIGEALAVPPGLSTKEELEEWRQKAEDGLMEVTKDKII